MAWFGPEELSGPSASSPRKNLLTVTPFLHSSDATPSTNASSAALAATKIADPASLPHLATFQCDEKDMIWERSAARSSGSNPLVTNINPRM